jgi:rod shape-determining protein MreD
MTWVVMILSLLLAAVAQTLVPGYACLGQVKFPFLICVVLYYALHREFHVVAVAGFLAGLMQDLLCDTPTGYSAVCLWVSALILSRFRSVVVTESLVTLVAFGALAGILTTGGLYLLLVGNGHVEIPTGRALVKILGAGLLGMATGPLVVGIVLRLDRWVGNADAKEEYDGIV